MSAAFRAPLAERSHQPFVSGADPVLHRLIGDAAEVPILKALLRISDAVLSSDYFDEVLEVIAEQALVALRAASVSISRWEREGNILRTLINVGDLAAHEERWPTDEHYEVGVDSDVTDLLIGGRAYSHCIDDDRCPPESRQLLVELGKECELGVPIVHGDVMWGEILASSSGGHRFDHGDAQLLQAIATYTAVAIARSELLNTVSAYAFEDALTGIANRRAVDRWFEQQDWATSSIVALMCDLDGFKQINDRDGHPAGDQLLRHFADVLTSTVGDVDGAMVGRLGGDEFCVLLADATLADAQRFANDATRRFRETLSTSVTISWGAATSDAELGTGGELLDAADAALIEAKRHGPAHYSAVRPTDVVPGGPQRLDRQGMHRSGLEALCRSVVDITREHPGLSAMEALEVLAVQMQQLVGTCAYALSVVNEAGTELVTLRKVDIVRDTESGLAILTHLGIDGCKLADFPETARAIAEASTFVAARDLPGSDPAEVALLEKLGYAAVLAVGVHGSRDRYLAEFYSGSGHEDLVAIAPVVQVLTCFCVHGRTGD
ncbi:sensor domain-containing diguanylate cyclase [Mycolicibacterium sp. BiH015]|uniref:GGDEF domain-containing protein n=1 Tax=Mycolicibacterium sp. BiH015 TaxID=3018808 RepID=UPI0022E1589B|nr:sensor domain-containing diguanylate cyclase [Mycolicibacterium sp. BiH015]MDA2892149.1 sensor domain-containing diguanylate cyclase [Mycolicibacterium sp. BiH015]